MEYISCAGTWPHYAAYTLHWVFHVPTIPTLIS